MAGGEGGAGHAPQLVQEVDGRNEAVETRFDLLHLLFLGTSNHYHKNMKRSLKLHLYSALYDCQFEVINACCNGFALSMFD
jgi:hypothetical protein